MLIELVTIGRDSELKFTPSGNPVLNFPAAYDVGYGDKKKTQWLDCAIFGKKGESLEQYILKGKQIQIVATDLCLEQYQTRDGQPGAKLRCVVTDVKFCRDGHNSEAQHQGNASAQSRSASAPRTAGSASKSQQTPPAGFDDLEDFEF